MKIICENASGGRVTFGYFSPLWVAAINGLGAEYSVYTSKNSGQDGENFNGSDAIKRNIIVSLDIVKADYLSQRTRLFEFFQPRAPGTLYYYEGDTAKKIAYYTERVTPSGTDNDSIRTVTISLICPDPKFYALTEEATRLAMWEGNIRFPLRIANPFYPTRKISALIKNVRNDSADVMGLTVRFKATGTVVNPSLYDVNRHELMQVNQTMHAGDVITVTTGAGNKRVQLVSGGVTANINNRMVYPPHWLQAYQGDNLFRYNADAGIDSLSVTILSTQAYWGA